MARPTTGFDPAPVMDMDSSRQATFAVQRPDISMNKDFEILTIENLFVKITVSALLPATGPDPTRRFHLMR
jgi:hypothetical protein